MADEDEKDYEVGYGRPPKHTQFKPGQSGNPKGRPKDSRNIKTVLHNVAMEEVVFMTKDGNTIAMSNQEALVRKLFQEAQKGNTRAAKVLLDTWKQWSGSYWR